MNHIKEIEKVIFSQQAKVEDERRAAELARQFSQAAGEVEHRERCEKCAALLPEYMRPYVVVGKSETDGYHAKLWIELPEIDYDHTPLAPVVVEFYQEHTGPKLYCFWLPEVRNGGEDYEGDEYAPSYYWPNRRPDCKTAEDALYQANVIGAKYHEAMIEWAIGAEARAAKRAQREAQAKARAAAKEAQKAHYVAVAERLQADPVLKTVFELLAAIVREREGYTDTIASLEEATEVIEDRASRQAEKARNEHRRELESLKAEADNARHEAEQAEKRAKRLEREQ